LSAGSYRNYLHSKAKEVSSPRKTIHDPKKTSRVYYRRLSQPYFVITPEGYVHSLSSG